MSQSPELHRLLQRLAAASSRDADASTEERVLAAFRAHRTRSRLRRFYWTIAAACLAIAMVWIAAYRAAPHKGRMNQAASLTSGFVALPYAQSEVPLEEAVIIRVDLTPSAWGALNVRPSPKTGGGIRADLLIGQDGVARAVRVISVQQ